MGDWNAILDPNIDRAGQSARGSGRCDSSLVNFLAVVLEGQGGSVRCVHLPLDSLPFVRTPSA